MALPNERAAITIPVVRELPRAIAKRVRLPRGRTALIVAILAVVAIATATAVVPLSVRSLMAEGPTPAAGATGLAGAGHPSSGTAAASSSPTAFDYASGRSASPQPTATWSAPTETPTAEPSPSACVPAPYVACDTTAAPTPLPSADPEATPFGLRVPILEYHRIKPFDTETGYQVSLVVPPDLFAAQMDALRAAGWQTITMGQLGDDLRRGIEPVPKSFVVTFDDGYEDGYTYAFPILQNDLFLATYFVIGSQIDKPGRLTVTELQALFGAGNEIGNHSMSHEDMRYMPEDRLVTETFGTSGLIARAVGVWPQSFSYPVGFTGPAVISALSKCPGIETAVIQGGSKPETWQNRFGLPRIRVGPGTNAQDLVERMNRYLP
jgi:peptidoglycan/xylan/chitin deacetylase (PgdA/CDA1 family)